MRIDKFYSRINEMMSGYEPHGKNDNKRLAYVNARIESMKIEDWKVIDDGLAGKIFEILNRPSTSRLIEVQAQSKIDSRLRIDGHSIKIEIKTGDGDVRALLDGTSNAELVVYKGYWGHKKKGIEYEDSFEPIIVPINEFVDMLDTIAKVSKNGTQLNIRMNKHLAEWVDSYPHKYDRNIKYSMDMFK